MSLPEAAVPSSPHTPLERLNHALGEVVLGQAPLIADLLTALLARGHVLLEGVPGLAKTLLARAAAQAVSSGFSRVQFTPDLMPSDLLGTYVFRPQTGAFELVKGPIFTEVLLADEINRTPPKTQAALLEAMEERQVTLDGKTHPLGDHFFVIATQNPLELEGTYPLPEAQLDRFLMRIKVGYPAEEAEVRVARDFHQRKGRPAALAKVIDRAELEGLQRAAAEVRVDESVIAYCVLLARRTREDARVKLGASPRAALALLGCAKGRAVLEGRDFVTPDDVKAVAPSVMGHRLILSPESEVEGLTTEAVIAHTLEQVRVPR